MPGKSDESREVREVMGALSARVSVLELLIFSLVQQCSDKNLLRKNFEQYAEMLQAQALPLALEDSYLGALSNSITDIRNSLLDL